MNEIDHFKLFIFYSDDMIADMYYLHIKRIHLMSFSFIVVDDFWILKVEFLKLLNLLGEKISCSPIISNKSYLIY
jgi:hypothetical protein